MTASKERILKICEYCGKSFYASKSTTRYCSKQCNSYAYKAARREEKVKMAETMSHRKASEKSMSEILMKEYLTIQEVAILLGLSRQTIYNMVYSGKLRASKITSRPSLSKTLGNLALICQKWSLKLLLLKSGGTRAVQKGAKKASCSKFCSIAQLLSNIRYFELKKPKNRYAKKTDAVHLPKRRIFSCRTYRYPK